MENNTLKSEETTVVDKTETEKEVVKTENTVPEINKGADEHSDASKEENVNDVEFTDTPKDETPKAKEETKQDNSENARRRREEERQNEIKKVRYNAIKEAVDGVNPYTNEKLETDVDVEQYLEMKEIAKNGGDPLKDYSKFVKDKRNEEFKKEQENIENEEWVANDYKDFVSKHPEVDIEKIAEDEAFKKYAESRIGKEPMATIYEGYTDLVSMLEKREKETMARQVANAKATPGSLTSSESVERDFYTLDEIRAMSQEEVNKNLDKVLKSYARATK